MCYDPAAVYGYLYAEIRAYTEGNVSTRTLIRPHKRTHTHMRNESVNRMRVKSTVNQ